MGVRNHVPRQDLRAALGVLEALDRLKLDVTTIAGVHGRVGTIEDLRRAVQLQTHR